MSKRNVVFLGNCFTLITWMEDCDSDEEAIEEANKMLMEETGWDVLAACSVIEVEVEMEP